MSDRTGDSDGYEDEPERLETYRERESESVGRESQREGERQTQKNIRLSVCVCVCVCVFFLQAGLRVTCFQFGKLHAALRAEPPEPEAGRQRLAFRAI